MNGQGEKNLHTQQGASLANSGEGLESVIFLQAWAEPEADKLSKAHNRSGRTRSRSAAGSARRAETPASHVVSVKETGKYVNVRPKPQGMVRPGGMAFPKGMQLTFSDSASDTVVKQREVKNLSKNRRHGLMKNTKLFMRLILVLTLVLLFMAGVCPAAFAAYTGPSEVAAPVSSVAEALGSFTGRTCFLTGNITRHLEKDMYVFKDAGGEMQVYIPSHVFGALQVGADTKVKVVGEMVGFGKRNPEGPKQKGQENAPAGAGREPRPADFRKGPHLNVRYIEIIK